MNYKLFGTFNNINKNKSTLNIDSTFKINNYSLKLHMCIFYMDNIYIAVNWHIKCSSKIMITIPLHFAT